MERPSPDGGLRENRRASGATAVGGSQGVGGSPLAGMSVRFAGSNVGVQNQAAGSRYAAKLPVSNAISDLDQRGGGTGKALLRVSLQLFSTQSFRGTSVRDIARALGTSVSAMYYFAASKEAILNELMELDLRWLVMRAHAVLVDASDPIEQVQALVHAHLIRDEVGLRLLTLADMEVGSIRPEERPEIVALRDEYEKLWRDAIGAGVSRGVFRMEDSKLAAFALLDMCNGVARWFSPNGTLSIQEIADRFSQFAVNLLTGGMMSADSRSAARIPADAGGAEIVPVKKSRFPKVSPA